MNSPTRALDVQHEADWQALVHRLPADLDTSAFQYLALLRKRGVRDAATLLRLILAYASGLSMPLVTAWAAATGLATLTPEALCGRLRQAHRWLAYLVSQLLLARAQASHVPAVRLCLLDSTTIPRAGTTGRDWRGHLSYDLHTHRLEAALLTDDGVGESAAHFTYGPGDLVCADRNFGKRPGLRHLIATGADVLVRVIWRQFPLQEPSGDAFPLWERLATLVPGAHTEWAVRTTPTQATRERAAIPALPGRLIAYRLTAQQAASAQQRLRRRRSRQSKGEASPLTVAGWQYLLLFTTLPTTRVSTEQVLALYRVRWQIEMAIKRYKSLCGLDDLSTRRAASCRTVVWAKLLLILLTEDLGTMAESFFP